MDTDGSKDLRVNLDDVVIGILGLRGCGIGREPGEGR